MLLLDGFVGSIGAYVFPNVVCVEEELGSEITLCDKGIICQSQRTNASKDQVLACLRSCASGVEDN